MHISRIYESSALVTTMFALRVVRLRACRARSFRVEGLEVERGRGRERERRVLFPSFSHHLSSLRVSWFSSAANTGTPPTISEKHGVERVRRGLSTFISRDRLPPWLSDNEKVNNGDTRKEGVEQKKRNQWLERESDNLHSFLSLPSSTNTIPAATREHSKHSHLTRAGKEKREGVEGKGNVSVWERVISNISEMRGMVEEKEEGGKNGERAGEDCSVPELGPSGDWWYYTRLREGEDFPMCVFYLSFFCFDQIALFCYFL